jgi:hypothetical protein
MRRELAAAVADAQIDLTRVRETKISILEQINAIGILNYRANPDWLKPFRLIARSGFDRFLNDNPPRSRRRSRRMRHPERSKCSAAHYRSS